ncbi:MAG: HEAT repeat domain-containing protein, partial [Fibromonadales bacterium]|nr:HEAT repeat domain-containing protein [Fibromonadales bacterium]
SVVNAKKAIPTNKVDASFFIDNLSSLVLSERYAAAKALSYFDKSRAEKTLLSKLRDENEHIYVKLEAAASLSRFGNTEGYSFIQQCLADNYLQNVLEAVIVLAEICSVESCKMLCDVLLDERHDQEIRAGAAWGLGEQQNSMALLAITKSFNSVEENIRIEAARALAKFTNLYSNDILNIFCSANSNELPGIAWALSKSDSISIDQLISKLDGTEFRQWISYIIGMQGEERYVAEIEKLKEHDAEVYFAATLLWKIISSWVYGLKEY